MEIQNYTSGEFYGYILMTGIYIWLILQIFSGFGIFKDAFYTSHRKRR